MKKVVLLFGGNSSEHLVSCLSAKSILENIDKKKYDVTAVGISKDNNWYIFNDDYSHLEKGTWLDVSKENIIADIIGFIKNIDVVFPITHGTNGEDGKLQGFLDLFGVKYVGCKTLSGAIGMDKHMSKIIFESLNIPQIPYIVTNSNEIDNTLGYPVIVKPCNGGSSIGITKANNDDELKKAIEIAKQYDNKVIIEKFVKARELECSALETDELYISSIGEIKNDKEFYDYESKYFSNSSYTIIPDDLKEETINTIKDYAKKAFNGLCGSGFSRIDFFYDQVNDIVYLNEINTLPGFTTISMFPKLLVHDGISYPDIISKLIDNA